MPRDYAALREDMVTRQIARRGIDDPRILAVFHEVPRECFVPREMKEFAYDDGPLPIGDGQTISQPYIVACMIDAAHVGRGDKVLEVGAGSGYAAAVLSRISERVFAIERHANLARKAAERIEQLGYSNCTIIAGDGMLGLPEESPFDAILVAARGAEVPQALKEQLAVDGSLIIPVGGEDVQQLRCITRTGANSWESHDIAPVRFVPLRPGVAPEDGTRSASDHRPARERELREMIADAAVVLPEIDGEHFASAFDRYANRRVVMLGECSHGTHEFYAARCHHPATGRAARLHHHRGRRRLARRRRLRPLDPREVCARGR